MFCSQSSHEVRITFPISPIRQLCLRKVKRFLRLHPTCMKAKIYIQVWLTPKPIVHKETVLCSGKITFKEVGLDLTSHSAT